MMTCCALASASTMGWCIVPHAGQSRKDDDMLCTGQCTACHHPSWTGQHQAQYTTPWLMHWPVHSMSSSSMDWPAPGTIHHPMVDALASAQHVIILHGLASSRHNTPPHG